MGMYSNFIFAEPSDLKIDLTNFDFNNSIFHSEIKNFKTLKELGEYFSGWKIYGYLDYYNKQHYNKLITFIHNQHPEVNFKIHFWYEEEIMFYFCWDKEPVIKYGKMDDARYFVSNEILHNINKKYLIDRFEGLNKQSFINKCFFWLNRFNIFKIKWRSNTINMNHAIVLSKKEVTDESNKMLLYLPMYLKHNPYFQTLRLS